MKSISIEILFENRRNTIFNVLHRQPRGQIVPFEKFLKQTFSRIKSPNKQFHVAGDFNLNVLDYEICKKTQEFLNIIYENGMIPITNKPARITNKTAIAIDHILTNPYTETIFKTAILKCDVSDHFPICLVIPSLKISLKNKIIYSYKRSFNEQTIFNFKKKLFQIDWQEIETLQNPRDAYTYFLEQFLTLYDTFFPLKKIKIKAKDLRSPWITNGIKKSSKRKQRLCNKFLKNRNEDNETEYKNYRKLFAAIKNVLKRTTFPN